MTPPASNGAATGPGLGLGPGVRLVEAGGAPLLARPYFAGGDPGPIVAALALVPELLEATAPFLGAVLGPSAVPLRLKEMVILRTSARASCRYCVEAHTVVARDAGLTVAEVRALRGEADIDGVFADASERAAIGWCDAVVDTGAIPEGARAALASSFPEHLVVELTLLAATTLLLNRFCTALRLPTSPAVLDRLAAEGLAAEGPAAEGPAAEGPAAEGPAAEGPAAEGPAAEGPAAEGLAAEGLAAEGLAAEGPA